MALHGFGGKDKCPGAEQEGDQQAREARGLVKTKQAAPRTDTEEMIQRSEGETSHPCLGGNHKQSPRFRSE